MQRFGITFHRLVRGKGIIKNNPEEIPGIGESTASVLLKEFRSVKNIKPLTERDITKVIGVKHHIQRIFPIKFLPFLVTPVYLDCI